MLQAQSHLQAARPRRPPRVRDIRSVGRTCSCTCAQSRLENSPAVTSGAAEKTEWQSRDGGDTLEVEGVARLSGFAEISGGKNAVLPLLAASLLCRSPVTLRRVPDIADVRAMLDVLVSVGAAVYRPDPSDPSVVIVDASGPLSPAPDAAAARALSAVRRTRAGFLVLAPLVARLGSAHVAMPGGCAIGARPVDLHRAVLSALGASTEEAADGVTSTAPARAAGGAGLRGGEIELRFPSVGATETALMAAATADGRTVIRNAAREPEVVGLARFLRACGARVSGEGTPVLTVEGVRGQSMSGTDWSVAPDRVEAATVLFAAAATRSELSLGPVVPEDLRSVLQALRRAGCEVEEAEVGAERRRLSGGASSSSRSSDTASAGQPLRGETALRIRPPRMLLAAGVSATPFPGFPTDCQPAWCAVIAAAGPFAAANAGDAQDEQHAQRERALQYPLTPGVEMRDSVFEGRLSHLRQLEAFGLGVRPLSGREAELWPAAAMGGGSLRAADVEATDLRCAAALLVAALAADGTSRIRGAWHLDRGYERVEEKLAALGARIRRVR